MKKNNAKASKKTFNKHVKNKARKERADKQREWHHMVAQVKFMQDYFKKAQEANEDANQVKEA
jgi:hypothetical protein